MTTSGTVNYSDNEIQLITDTLIYLRVIGKDQQISAYDLALGSRWLNRMVKSWMTDGLQLWATTTATLFPQYNQNTYSLGSTSNTPGGDNASNTYVSTTSSSAAAINATTITLTSVTGMSVNDNIGIHQNDTHGTRFWTTISGINTGTKVVTLNAGIPSGAVSGATVVTYTTALNRPMDIYFMSRFDLTSSTEIPMEKYSREQYQRLPFKTSLGVPLQYYYDPQLGQGQLHFWPTPNNVDLVCNVTYLRPLQDFNNSTDTPDFPIEWDLALITNLAVYLAPSYGKASELKELAAIAGMELKKVKDWDNERVIVQLVPKYPFEI